MNERFREIAKSASDWCIENAKGTPVAWEWEEKFAELIVQRCLEIIESEASMYSEPVWAISLFNEITEHFGIDSESEIEYCPKCNVEWSGTSCGIPDCGWITGVEE